MFAINNEQVKAGSPEEAEIIKGIAQMKAVYSFPITIKYPRHLYMPDPKQPRVKKGGAGLPMFENYVSESGTRGTIQYYESFKVDKFGVKTFTLQNGTTRLMFRGHLMLHENNLELAYFITKFSKGLYDPKTNKNGYFIIENKERDAKMLNEKRKQDGMMAQWIYNDLARKDDLFTLARFYEVNTNGLSEEEVRANLYDRAVAVGYDKFSKNKIITNTVKDKALIQEAIETGLIAGDNSVENIHYFTKNGKMDIKIGKISTTGSKLDALYAHFMQWEDDFKTLESKMGRLQRIEATDVKYTDESQGVTETVEILKARLDLKGVTYHPMAGMKRLKELCLEHNL